MKNLLTELPVPTHHGRFTAYYSDKGLAGLKFPHGGAGLACGSDAQWYLPAEIHDKIHDWHRATESALRKILAGNEPDKLPPLDLVGTAFQKRVWSALRKIPRGKTRCYSDIARAIGKPKAVRAVGGACGANPIPVLVPCHRVLAANKKIGGFSGGLNWKRTLLAREGVKF